MAMMDQRGYLGEIKQIGGNPHGYSVKKLIYKTILTKLVFKK